MANCQFLSSPIEMSEKICDEGDENSEPIGSRHSLTDTANTFLATFFW